MTPAHSDRPDYPPAERTELVELVHGHRLADPYRWLEDPADERALAWSAAQDALFKADRASWPGRDRWHAELAALTAVDRVLPPKPRGGHVFLRRHAAGRDHPVLYVVKNGVERVLVDPSELDPEGGTVLDHWEPSLEGDLVAVQLSRGGTEDSELTVLDVATGAVVDGPIGRLRRSPIAWLPGGHRFYYVRRIPGEDRYHRRVWLHRIGQNPEHDEEVFGQGRGKTQFYDVALSADGRWLAVTATAGTAPGTDVYLTDLGGERPQDDDSPGGAVCVGARRPWTLQESTTVRTRPHVPPGTKPGDPIWLRTDLDAPRGRVVVTAAADGDGSDPATWREAVPERRDAVLTDFAVLTGPDLPGPIGLASWLRHAVAEVTVHDLSGRGDPSVLPVPLPGPGVISGFSVPPGGAEAWFMYADHVTPPGLLHYDARIGVLRPWPTDDAASDQRAPSGFGAVATVETFHSADGTSVRMFVVSPAGVPDQPRPTILTGYGGFGVPMTPAYSPEILAWVRAGGVHATACLRGGSEEGEEWHRAGQGAGKTRVFEDFEAAADALVAGGWTTPDLLGLSGASNGGLLVGAALIRRPDAYAAVVCSSPLLDMARYELSGLGPSWVSEYGSAEDPEQLGVLLSYSPYHQVREGTAYPAVLFTVADGDTRVDPAHARKMCAALQHASVSQRPILLWTERDVGHGQRSLSRLVAAQADRLAFLAARLGLDAPGGLG